MALKDRISLDWLEAARSQAATARVAPPSPVLGSYEATVEDARTALSLRVLRAVKGQGDAAHLHELLPVLDLRLSEAVPVVDQLVKGGYLQPVDADPASNFALRLTAKGEALADFRI